MATSLASPERAVLITIPISHFCEKARWALQRAGIPFREEGHLQIFHYLRVLTAAGSVTVPVLQTEQELVRDSTDIARWADRFLPAEHRLFPEGKLGAEVAAWEELFDLEIGPLTRRIAYQWLLPRRDLIERYNVAGVPKWQAATGLLALPVAALYLRARNGAWASRLAEDLATMDTLFSRVSSQLQDGRPFIAGERFTAADLALASLCAVVLLPREYGVPLPSVDELPEEAHRHVLRWRQTPAGRHVMRLYAEERPVVRGRSAAEFPRHSSAG